MPRPVPGAADSRRTTDRRNGTPGRSAARNQTRRDAYRRLPARRLLRHHHALSGAAVMPSNHLQRAALAQPLRGRTALVTGAATGIGAAISYALAAAGATVALCH